MKKSLKKRMAVLLSASVVAMSVGQARAMLVPTAQAIPALAQERIQDLNTVRSFLEKKEVSQRLADFGMNQQDIQTRLNSLSDHDLHHVALRIEKQNPAADGGGVLVTVLVIGVLALLFVYLLKRV